MTTSGRQVVLRRRTVVAVAIAATVLLPFTLPAGAENLLSGTATAPLTGGALGTANQGATTTTGVVQKVGSGTPLQQTTNKTATTTQKTVAGTTGALRQTANPAPPPGANPPAGVPVPGQAPAVPTSNPMPAPPAEAVPPATSAGSASGLRVNAASMLLASEATAAPLVAGALSSTPSALVLVAEPLSRSLNGPLALAPDASTTSGGSQEVQAVSNLPRGLLTEALIAAALLVAATAALVAELGLKRSSPSAV